MIRLLLLVVPLAVLAGCKTENPAYCGDPANAGMQGCPGDATNGGGCSSDGECKMAGFPVCVKADEQGTCKACSDENKGACAGMTPRCESNACVACEDDVKDCGGGVCLATGDCADASRIIHARSGSNQTSNCGDSATNACSLGGAIMLATSGKDVIKLDGQDTFMQNGVTVSKDVTIDARGATLTRGDNGPVLTVMGGKTLTLLGGTIHGTAGKDGDGISCSGTGSTLVAVDTKVETNDQSGITADTCTLNLTRVTVDNNSQKAGAFAAGITVNKGSITLAQSHIDSNNGGGLSITNAVIQIVGNVFSNNGPPGTPDPPSTIGGIFIMTTGNPANRLDFNTITGNHAQIGNGPGLQCTAGNLAVRNNIIYGNNDNAVVQFLGNCQPMYSDLGFTTIDNNNNTHADPMFGTAFQLTASSPLLGKADPNADLGGIASKDINGDPRVKRSGMGADIGADQYYPTTP
jgi:hypothetical protein